MRFTKNKRLFLFITLSIALLHFSKASTEPNEDSQIPISGFKPEQEILMSKNQEKFEFQSDIARLMRVVVSHLYHDRDVFLRELISNSGDALEKLRFASLTDSSVLDTAPALNISIMADKPSKRLIIRDSGVGMTKSELQKNLGTIARSGTSEFLSKLEKGEKTGTSSNLIGQFGLGFYSSFLVADRVLVSSKSNSDDKQWVFESNADAAEFKISEDPRGNSLGRGTEITLYIKDDATDYLEVDKLKELISTHSEFSTTAPIYLWTEKEEEVPVEEEEKPKTDTEKDDSSKTKEKTDEDKDDDELKIDEDDEDSEDSSSTSSTPKTKTVKKQVWDQLNTKGPIWTRDPKEVSDEDYISFYKGLTSQTEAPSSWIHFKGDAGRTAFHGLIFIPETLPADFYTKTYADLDSVRLFVRKVLITKEPSPDFIPKWFNWIKVIIDADDLPLNVGRDSLQVNKSLRQIQNIILKKFLDHLNQVAKKEPEKYTKLWKKIGTTLKVGAVEDSKNRDKLSKLMRFHSSESKEGALVSLEEYVARRKKNQKQIYFIAGSGMEVKDLSRSPFVEKLVARGYEVLYLVDPMDEMITQNVAKKGLKMGDEDEDEDEKAAFEEYKKEYEPLSNWIKKELDEYVGDVVISNRLTTSPCAVVADSYAWTGNMERLMAAQGSRGGSENNFMMDMIKKAKKVFEINPKHPLIQGLLSKVPESGEEADEELRYVVRTLWDTSLVRSGFNVVDNNAYFDRIEVLLRKSIGVDEKEKVDVGEIKPAPPIEVGPVDGRKEGKSEEKSSKVEEEKKEEWKDWSKVKEEMKKEKEEVKEEEKMEVEEKEEDGSEEKEEGKAKMNEANEKMKDELKKLEDLLKGMKGGKGEDGKPDLGDLDELMKGFGGGDHAKDEL
ncbi:Hsp90 protein-domain-containing protein [Melampsora americana]|nr:Hsp90 protein-domain-containing protein [Melampsora americana]